MHILHVITTIDRGGAELQLLTLVRKQIERGNRVELVYLKGGSELLQDFINLGTIVHTRLVNKNIFSQILELLRLQKSNFDLFHAHLPRAELLSSLCNRWTPLLVSRHNTQRFIDRVPRISVFIARFVEKRAVACIAISHAVSQFLLDTKEWNSADTLYVVHYGIDEKRVHHGQGSTSLKPYQKFLAINRLVPQKDIPTILCAFSLHLKSFPEDRLFIIGEGPERNQLETMTRDLLIDSSVEWVGTTPDVSSYLTSSTALILASKYEGFGLVLLEAMCANLPIFASNISAIPEVLGVDHPGLFEVGNINALARLLEESHNNAAMQKIVKSQNRRLNIFSSDSMMDNMESLYSKICSVNK